MHSPSVHPHQHLHRKAEPYRPLRKLYVDIPGMGPQNTMETFWCKQRLIGGLQSTNKSCVWKESTGIVKATLWNWIPDSFDRNEKSVKFTYVSLSAFYKLANSRLCILLETASEPGLNKLLSQLLLHTRWWITFVLFAWPNSRNKISVHFQWKKLSVLAN